MDMALAKVLESRVSEENIYTYQNLLDDLLKIKENNPELLQQSVQAVENNPTPDPDRLLPCLGVDTCDKWGLDNTKNVDDFKHHETQLVILTDCHPFGKNGEIAYEWLGRNEEDNDNEEEIELKKVVEKCKNESLSILDEIEKLGYRKKKDFTDKLFTKPIFPEKELKWMGEILKNSEETK